MKKILLLINFSKRRQKLNEFSCVLKIYFLSLFNSRGKTVEAYPNVNVQSNTCIDDSIGASDLTF